MKKIFYTICIIALIASPVFAADASNDTTATTGSGATEELAHSITLLDTNGGGGGILSIKIANGSTAAYSGAAGAGGQGAANAGQVMCAVGGSLRADPDIALYIGVRGSQDPNVAEDNQVYQNPASGTAIANSTCVTAVDASIAGWSIRGGS